MLLFENNERRTSYKKYFLPTSETKFTMSRWMEKTFIINLLGMTQKHMKIRKIATVERDD